MLLQVHGPFPSGTEASLHQEEITSLPLGGTEKEQGNAELLIFFFNNVQIVNKLGIELYFLSLEKRVSMLTVDH